VETDTNPNQTNRIEIKSHDTREQNVNKNSIQDDIEQKTQVRPKLSSYDLSRYVLKVGAKFYKGTMDKSKITSITFTSQAPSKYDEKWYANEKGTWHVTGYRVGTDVFIVGKKIIFNKNCGMMFCVRDAYGGPMWASLEAINGLGIVDTSLVENMNYMFIGGDQFQHLDVGSWDVSNVKSMKMMFAGCKNLRVIDVSSWDVGNVETFVAMFQGSNHVGDMNLEYIDVSNWDTSSADNMSYMFYGCSKIKSIDVSKWDVKKVETFSHMFADCFSLTTIDISKWDTLSVDSFDALFNDCRNLKTIDVSGLETNTCIQFSQMFESCVNLEEIVGLEKWDTSNASHYAFSETFHNCSKLTELDLSTWDTSKADNMARMFAGCSGLRRLDVSGWYIENVETMLEMFEGCSTELKLVGLDR
jgi:surface protein